MALCPIFCVALGLVLSVKAKDSDPKRETLRNIFTEGHKDHKEVPIFEKHLRPVCLSRGCSRRRRFSIEGIVFVFFAIFCEYDSSAELGKHQEAF